jgi:transglutaminase-like putative cysteine protease
MDFSAWFDVYLGNRWLGNRWYAFDARDNQRRSGRVLMARSRDDVAIASGRCLSSGDS